MKINRTGGGGRCRSGNDEPGRAGRGEEGGGGRGPCPGEQVQGAGKVHLTSKGPFSVAKCHKCGGYIRVKVGV